MRLPLLRRVSAAGIAIALAAPLAACGGGDPVTAAAAPSAGPSAEASPSESASPTPSPTPQLRSALTGLPIDKPGKILALKVDNAPLARRFQVGLDRADVVYEEVAEAGLTRFLAVYASQSAPKIGPIRSVRESDLELLRQYGKVLFGFSGGNKGVLRTVAGAQVVDVSYDAVPGAYTMRKGERRDAYNFYTSTERLYSTRAKAGELEKPVGFTFGALPAAAAATPPVNALSVGWSDKASTGFTYDASNRVWLRSNNGTPATQSDGARMRAGTVVVQYVPVRGSKYVDVAGSRTPYTVTVGGGKAEIYREGRKITGQWVRQSATSGTRFVYPGGTDIPFKPGPVWVLLVPNNLRVANS